MEKLKRVMSMIKVPNDLTIDIQRHRRQHQSCLNPRDAIKRLGRPALLQPNGQKLGRPKTKEIPQHDRKHGRLDADIAVRIEQVSKRVALLRHRREDHHAVYKAHHHPIDHVFWRRSACVPAEERETGDANEEAERDEVEAELGFVDVVVAAGSVDGGTIGERAHDDESHEGADSGEGVQVAELGWRVGYGWG